MTVEQTVLDRVLADTDVDDIVDGEGYLLILPQSPTLPAIRVQLISDIARTRLDGELTNLFWSRVQVDLFTHTHDNGDGYVTARDGSAAIRNALMLPSAGGQHFFSTDSPASIEVTSVTALDTVTDYEPPPLRQIRVRQDFGIMFREVQA